MSLSADCLRFPVSLTVSNDVLRLLAFTCLLLPVCIAYAADTITVSEAWIAESPPATPVNAGYMHIHNHGQTTVTLQSVESPEFVRVEMHQSVTINGMTRMEHIHSIDIEPGQQLVFAPGDLHLMLYNSDNPPQGGETIPLTLRFADGTTRQTDAGVRKMSDSNQSNHHQPQSSTSNGILSQIKVFYQHLLPQHFLSGLMYRLTRISWPPLKSLLIKNFIRIYHVDMSIAAIPDPEQFQTFNEFFTRALKPAARPLDPAMNVIVSPVDGVVSQHGRITGGKLLQAKDRDYTVEQLLGGDRELASRFANGEFITLYLSPKDYHRIHMPLTGTLQSMTYVPGRLFSVSPATTLAIDNLFARNERLIQIFQTEIGQVALVMVGAIFVGSMETTWAGQVTPARIRNQWTRNYPGSGQPVQIIKGGEMGRFNMGSSVILLFEQDRLNWDASVRAGLEVRLGRKIAEMKRPAGNQAGP